MADGARPEHARTLIIQPYLGYGTPRRLRLLGRVLKAKRMPPASAGDRRWRNLVRFYRHLRSDEVPSARLDIRFGKVLAEALADREGYFDVELGVAAARPGWQRVALQLASEPAVRASARVLVPHAEAAFGVISDIDDTVVYSNVASKLRMIVALALSNAHTRKPFAGAAAFYRALHRGVNPLFYVSKSPWNLYLPLLEYLHLQRFPRGPLLLRDYGLRMQRDHKRTAIEAILGTYPRLPFILIGDSGERDPEIYGAIVHRYPERIRAIYIRCLSRDPRRLAALDRLAREVAATGCQLVAAEDSAAAAMHAAAEGLIQPSALPAIRAGRCADETSRSKPGASSGALK